MLALSELIDFLLDLLGDPQARAAFEQDPDAVLAERGLDGATAQDVRDARLVLADEGSARSESSARPPGGDDPVREIHYTTANFTAVDDVARADHHEPGLVSQSSTAVTIDDRDTFFFRDSFNSDDDVTIVADSFNSDDDGIDTGGGDLSADDNSVTDTDVVAIDADNSFNKDVDSDVVAIDADNSFNEGDSTDVDVLAIDVAPDEAEPAAGPDAAVPDPAVPDAAPPDDIAPDDRAADDRAADDRAADDRAADDTASDDTAVDDLAADDTAPEPDVEVPEPEELTAGIDDTDPDPPGDLDADAGLDTAVV